MNYRKSYKKTLRNITMMTEGLNTPDDLNNKLVSVLVHDLREPFAAFITITDTLKHTKRSLLLNELNIILEDIRYMTLKSTGLLDGLLYWMRSREEGFTYEFEPLILSDLIREANSLYLYDQSCKSIPLYIIIPEDQLVYANKEMIQFINRSVLSNITNHSPYDGAIGVTCSVENDWITVAFVNQGNKTGLHQLKRLFDDRRAAIAGGCHLKCEGGVLSFCEDMIRQMDGKLWIESLPEQGVVFYCSLPLSGPRCA